MVPLVSVSVLAPQSPEVSSGMSCGGWSSSRLTHHVNSSQETPLGCLRGLGVHCSGMGMCQRVHRCVLVELLLVHIGDDCS